MAYDRTLVQIRERSFLELLDLALLVIRRRPVTLGLAAVLGIAPFAALNSWLLATRGLPTALLAYLWVLEVPWATAPLTLVIGGLMFGQRPSWGRVLRTLLAALPAMLVYNVIARGFLLVSFLFYPIVPSRLAFLNEVILLERSRWWAAVRRSSLLCASRGGEFFGQWLAQLFFGAVFSMAIVLGIGAGVKALTTSALSWEEPKVADFMGSRLQLALWLSVAFFAVVRFLNYIDQRIRLEGWELELRLRSAGQAMEDGRRW